MNMKNTWSVVGLPNVPTESEQFAAHDVGGFIKQPDIPLRGKPSPNSAQSNQLANSPPAPDYPASSALSSQLESSPRLDPVSLPPYISKIACVPRRTTGLPVRFESDTLYSSSISTDGAVTSFNRPSCRSKYYTWVDVNFLPKHAAKLRRDLVNRLVYGNYIQHLDIIVHHPDYGALVDSEVEIEAVDSRSWMSIIRMSVYQVKLVYLSPALNSPTGAPAILHLTEPSGFNVLSSISANNQSKLCEPHQIQLNTQLPSLRNTQTGTPTSVDMPGSPHATRAQNSSRNGY
ncbi:hypothetical protein MJO29_004233 [Puccinia striiformis f. sp. tritici]|nr:hypothetical protein MJO29_004233 [Puccinia striiformis f. sp. tritici]